jgi:hypothetical protein
MVRVSVALAFDETVSVGELKVQVEFAGSPLQVNVTVPLKPLMGATARVSDVLASFATVATELEVLKPKLVVPPVAAFWLIEPKTPCVSASRPAAKYSVLGSPAFVVEGEPPTTPLPKTISQRPT